MKKTYFLSPHFDIAPPPDGPLKLGHIIPGPDEPDIEPINPESHIEASPLPPMIRKGFSSTRNKLLSGELGVWAQVMATMGVHASAGFDKSSDDEINVKEIETQTFQPSTDYVAKSIAGGDVAQFLTQSKYKVPIYMITGLKIARGAAMGKGHGTTFKASGGLDVPIEDVRIGPGFKFKRSDEEHESFEESSDFVLAFRIQRIRFKLVDGKAEIRDRAIYTKGAEMMESEGSTAEGPMVVGLDEEADELPPEVKVLDGTHVDADDDGQLLEIARLT